MINEPNKNSTAAARTDDETPVIGTVIPIIEEEATIEKKIVEAGKVRISKHAREVEQLVDIPLLREEVSVERVPVNRTVEERLSVRYDGDTLIIPVVEEQVVMQKRLVLVEELHVKKQMIETSHQERVTLLKDEVEVTRVAADEKTGA